MDTRVTRHYPFLPFREKLPGRRDWRQIPADEVVRTREGILVRVLPDWMYSNVYFWGDYEPYHTKIYKQIVRAGDVTLDVGANFGWFSACFAKIGAEVHAFEPVPFIADLAAETLELNGLQHLVRLSRCGLGSVNEEATIFTFAGLPHGHASRSSLGRDDVIAHNCRIQRLDDYVSELGLLDVKFMKVDVEGFEREVFLGGRDFLSADQAPIIAFEINDRCLSTRSLKGSQVIGTLRALGYDNFFRFSIRQGIHRLRSDDVQSAECLAVKPRRFAEFERALHTGRLLR